MTEKPQLYLIFIWQKKNRVFSTFFKVSQQLQVGQKLSYRRFFCSPFIIYLHHQAYIINRVFYTQVVDNGRIIKSFFGA